MPTFDNGESGFSVRTKINAAIEKVDGTAPITAIDVNGGSIDGAIIGANAPVAVTATNLVANTDLTIASSTTVTAILDEDDLVSDSATALATQQSIKAYVDSQVGSTDELSEILANGNTSGANDIIINASQKITVDTIDETTVDGGVTIDSVLLKDNAVVAATGTFTNLTANTDLTIAGTVTITSVLDEDNMASDDPAGLATQQSIKAYVDAQVGANNELSEVLANGNTTGGSDIIVSSGDVITTNTINETTSASGVTIDGILLKDGDITLSGSVDGRDIAADGTKLDGIEASADVTDTANVTASGALMDSEITNLDQVKAFDSADYATAAQGTTADAALPKSGGAMTGAISTNSTFDGRDVATDGTKLDSIETSADVTDTVNVTAAGALMTTGGAMTGAITTNSTFDGRNVSADGTKLDFITVTQAVDLDQMEIDIAALANGMVYKGDWDASSGSFPGAGSAQIGWFYYVSVAGTVDGVSFDVGDNIVATTDNASSTTFAGNWSKHDQTDAVQSVVGLTGSIAKSSLLTALNVEDGADVTDTANVTAAGALMTTGGTMSGDINYGSSSAIFGTSPNTLSIYNDASNSYIDETGTGNLRIRGNNIQLEQSTGGELYMQGAADGAVRLYYDGSQRLLTTTTGVQVESDSAAAQIIIRSTEDGAGDGPRLDLYRDSATPAAADDIGQIYFSGENSVGGKKQYAKIDTFIESPTDGAETARLDVNLLSAGSGINMFRIRTDSGGVNGEVVINDASNDVDFRVESDNSQTALKVDGGTGIVSMSQGMAGLAMSGDLTFGDNDKAIFGDELEIFSDATHARIREYGSGQLKIQGDNMQLLTSDGASTYLEGNASTGAVTLYHASNAPRLATTSTGVDVTGNATFAVNGKAIFGAGSDLQIYHDGTHSYISDVGEGPLRITTDGTGILLNKSITESMGRFLTDGAVELYYDNAKKFETTSAGIDIKFDGGGSQMGIDIHNQGTAAGDDAAITFETQGSRNFTMGIDRSAFSFVIAESSTLTTNPRLVISDSGDVGIGATSPARKLVVAGNNNGGAKANYIRITDTDTTATANNQAGGIEFFTNDDTPGIAASIEVLYAGTGGGGELTFNTNASSSGTLTEAARIDSAGHTIIPAGVTLGTAVGVYNAAKTIDDYEEGTWNPQPADSSGNDATYAARSGNYTKIGNVVTATFFISNINTNGLTSGDDFRINDLPFASKSIPNGSVYAGDARLDFITFSGTSNMIILDNTDYIRIGENVSGAAQDFVRVTEVASGTADVRGSITYLAA